MPQTSSQLKDAPTLVELSRGNYKDGEPIIECSYRGIISVVNGAGHEIFSIGHTDTDVHMRSCAKPFQVLPLLELGFFDAHSSSSLKPYDLALMMSSHSGQAIHTSRVEELLALIGLDRSALRCGIHPPVDDLVRKELYCNHLSPTELHNNCSGKHTAMLFTCIKKGFDIKTYENINHPLQKLIKANIAVVSDVTEDNIAYGTDGCSLPSWVIPIKNCALMYARLARWREDLPNDKPQFLKNAFKEIWASATDYPEYLAGSTRFDTELMKAGDHRIFSKTGADGMHTLSILPTKKYPEGLGIAIKVADGDAKQTIRPFLIKKLLKDFGAWPNDASLDRFMPSFKNFRGLETGMAFYRF